jgi:hypothetical protein
MLRIYLLMVCLLISCARSPRIHTNSDSSDNLHNFRLMPNQLLFNATSLPDAIAIKAVVICDLANEYYAPPLKRDIGSINVVIKAEEAPMFAQEIPCLVPRLVFGTNNIYRDKMRNVRDTLTKKSAEVITIRIVTIKDNQAEIEANCYSGAESGFVYHITLIKDIKEGWVIKKKVLIAIS